MYKFVIPDAFLQRNVNQEEVLISIQNPGPIGHKNDDSSNQVESNNWRIAEEVHHESNIQLMDLNEIVKEYLDSPTNSDPNRHCFACGTRNWKQYSNCDGIFCGTCHP